jgi:hypothetical protein
MPLPRLRHGCAAAAVPSNAGLEAGLSARDWFQAKRCNKSDYEIKANRLENYIARSSPRLDLTTGVALCSTALPGIISTRASG